MDSDDKGAIPCLALLSSYASHVLEVHAVLATSCSVCDRELWSIWLAHRFVCVGDFCQIQIHGWIVALMPEYTVLLLLL